MLIPAGWKHRLLAEQIVKMDCDRCRLRTEHYLLDYGDTPTLCRCLRCGRVEKYPGLSSDSKEPYPEDNRKPVYVV